MSKMNKKLQYFETGLALTDVDYAKNADYWPD